MDQVVTARTRLASEVVVMGHGVAAVAAALAARAAGHRVLLAGQGTALASEVTVALSGDLGSVTDPFLSQLRDRLAAIGALPNGLLDPAYTELVVDRLLAEQGVDVLLYAVPLALSTDESGASGVLCGGKDGCYVISAGAVIDATPDGTLFAGSGAAFVEPATVTGCRTLYLQFAGEGLSGLPAEVAGFALTLTATWPGEVRLDAVGTAAWDGRSVPAALAHASRLAVPAIAAAAREHVPGLAAAAVSHTGHAMRPLSGRRLAAGDARHPALPNVVGAGAWVTGEGWSDLNALAASGTAAGRAVTAVRPLVEVETTVAEAPAETCDVAVVGGGTGGAIAGLAAGRQGAATLVLEAGTFLGGIGTGGGIHWYYHGVTGGLQDEIDAATRQLTDSLGGPARFHGFSPEAKKVALEQAATAAGVAVRYGCTVAEAEVIDGRLAGLLLVEPGRAWRLRATAFVDATGDGDVAAAAGAACFVGREGDGLNHAYTQSGGRLAGDKIAHHNFDAGYVDATDVVDLTRGRRHALQLFWRDQVDPAGRLLYVAPLLGLRQSRHIVGEYAVTLADQAAGRTFDDQVAYGHCHYDNHAYDYECESDEALFWCWTLGHWHRMMRHGVPYRSLVPRDLDGLVVGCRALSVTHDAHMLFRMQRDMQRVGEAAGTAAALAAQLDVPLRQVPLDRLQGALRATGALLESWPAGEPARTPEELVAALSGDDPTGACWQLYQLGEGAVPALREALASAGDPAWYAAVGLAMLGHADGAALLREALDTRDERVPATPTNLRQGQPPLRCQPRWVNAVALLGRLGDQAATPAITALLTDPSVAPDVLIAAVKALARIGDRAAISAIEALLEREDLPGAKLQNSLSNTGHIERDVAWQIRLAAAEALNQLGAPRPELIEAHLDDPRAYVRRYADRLEDELPGHRAATEATGRPGQTVRARRLEG